MHEKEPAQIGIQSEQEENQTSATMDIKALKAELENVKSQMVELQNDYCELQPRGKTKFLKNLFNKLHLRVTKDERRGWFVRVCIEVNLTKLVIGCVWIRGFWYQVQYERIHRICGSCGCY